MFFRMVKKDLQESRGLNVIIFFFMIVVSALAAASGFLLYVNVNGTKVTEERVNPHDFIGVYVEKNREVQRYDAEKAVREKYPDAVFKHVEGIDVGVTNFRYDGMEEDYDRIHNSMAASVLLLTTQSFDMDRMYTQDNEPFYVENGNVAVTVRFADLTGVKVGDQLKVTTQMGNIYAFHISHIVRDPGMDFVYRFILSEPDYELISKESPAKTGLFMVQLNNGTNVEESEIAGLISNYPTLKDYPFRRYQGNGVSHSNTTIVSILVSMFLLIASLFMLVVVFFALGFTIKAAIKKEERELGIMKALGTDSVSFRWLVAAKYIVFAIVGSAIGCVAGLLGGGMLVDRFFYNISYVFGAADYMITVLCAACVAGFVILYILLAMRKIDKISVMDVLHGETRADQMRHGERFQLNKSEKMPIALYLALKDLLGGFKKYILLFVAFTAGTVVVVTSIFFRSTVMNGNFLFTYYVFKPMDYVLNLTNKTAEELSLGTGRNDVIHKTIDRLMEQEGIPATIEFADRLSCKYIFEEGEEAVDMYYNFEPEGLRLREGGQYPKLRNEVVIDYFTAEAHKLAIGDKVTIEYRKLSPDRMSAEETKEEFIITGFVDRLAINGKEVIMGSEFHDGEVSESGNVISYKLNCPEREKDAYRQRLKELFPEDYMTTDEFVAAFLGVYDVIFTFMRNVFIVVVACILAFLVVMYQTIFMKDEEAEIALLTSTGIEDRTTKGWHILRMMILFVSATILGVLLASTLMSALTGLLFKLMIGLTGWKFSGGLGLAAIWIVFITVLIFIVIALVVRKTDKIEVWRIRNE